MSELIQIQSEKIKMDPIFERFEKEIFSFSSLNFDKSFFETENKSLPPVKIIPSIFNNFM